MKLSWEESVHREQQIFLYISLLLGILAITNTAHKELLTPEDKFVYIYIERERSIHHFCCILYVMLLLEKNDI
jgi:hypothetical protein